MDANRFNNLLRFLSSRAARRGVLAGFLGATIPLFSLTDSEARRKKKHRKGEKKKGRGRAPSCTDGVKNGSETGVDCGGPDCPRCANGQGCVSRGDCAGALCSSGTCRMCSLELDNCGEEADGQCYCAQPAADGSSVCTKGNPTGGNVTSCAACPPGTYCSDPSLGPLRCYKPCGDP